MCRHKLWMYLTLSDVDICKAKEENLKKMMKEYSDIESDVKLLNSICKYIMKDSVQLYILNLLEHQPSKLQSYAALTKSWMTA